MENLRKIIVGFLLCFIGVVANAQKIDVKGVVLDPTGESVIGASVIQKGTKTGTVTDIDGHFNLQVDNGATLVISYIGYETVEAKASTDMSVTLKEQVNDLNEVVVTGYTTQKKASIVGSIDNIKPDELHYGTSRDLSNNLAGKLSGVIGIQRS